MEIDIAYLRTGDIVEVRQPGTLMVYQGAVDLIVPQQGLIWIRYGPLQERKLIDASEYQIFKHQDAARQDPPPSR